MNHWKNFTFIMIILIKNIPLIFQILRGDYVEFYVDAIDETRSNWLRWINCSRNSKEENIVWRYCAGKVYLQTIKDVLPGQELLFYYGDGYAKSLDIRYKLSEE